MQNQVKFRNTRSRFYKPQENAKQKQDNDKSSPNTNTGSYWKDKGNQQFRKKNYNLALEHYTKAINLNENQSIFYSNRALCYHILKQYDLAIKDARVAIEIQPTNIKAQYTYGRSLAEKSKSDSKNIEPAIERLKKAHSLCKGQKKAEFEQQISIMIFRAKKLRWYLKNEQDMRLLKNTLGFLEMTLGKQTQQFVKLSKYFDQQKQKFIIPDYLRCKITLELMEDPVTTESGITYEREAIQDHFRNKKIDPYTNQPVSNKLVSNKALKQAILDFLELNPWAFEYTEQEDFRSIPFL